jgi:hypothetical protein
MKCVVCYESDCVCKPGIYTVPKGYIAIIKITGIIPLTGKEK